MDEAVMWGDPNLRLVSYRPNEVLLERTYPDGTTKQSRHAVTGSTDLQRYVNDEPGPRPRIRTKRPTAT